MPIESSESSNIQNPSNEAKILSEEFDKTELEIKLNSTIYQVEKEGKTQTLTGIKALNQILLEQLLELGFKGIKEEYIDIVDNVSGRFYPGRNIIIIQTKNFDTIFTKVFKKIDLPDNTDDTEIIKNKFKNNKQYAEVNEYIENLEKNSDKIIFHEIFHALDYNSADNGKPEKDYDGILIPSSKGKGYSLMDNLYEDEWKTSVVKKKITNFCYMNDQYQKRDEIVIGSEVITHLFCERLSNDNNIIKIPNKFLNHINIDNDEEKITSYLALKFIRKNLENFTNNTQKILSEVLLNLGKLILNEVSVEKNKLKTEIENNESLKLKYKEFLSPVDSLEKSDKYNTALDQLPQQQNFWTKKFSKEVMDQDSGNYR